MRRRRLSSAQTSYANTSKVSEAYWFACVTVLRARIANAKIDAKQLAGNYAVTSADPLFSGIFANELPPIPGEMAISKSSPTFEEVADQFYP